MDVVVSGSSGLIGTALRAALTDAGHRPVRLVRGRADGDAVSWDPAAGRIDAGGLEGVGAVVHLAGEPLYGRWTAGKKGRIRDSRVEGTQLLADALAGLQRPPEVLLSASAVGWYGSRGDEVLTESSPPGTGFLAEVCRDWEGATAPAERAGIRVVHLRTAPALSRRGGLLPFMALPFRLGVGGRLGSGRQWMAWIHLDDHVAAQLALLAHSDARGPFNLSAPAPVRNVDFTRVLARLLRRPAVVPVPRAAIATVVGADAADDLATASQRVLPQRLTEELGFAFAFTDLEAALRRELR